MLSRYATLFALLTTPLTLAVSLPTSSLAPAQLQIFNLGLFISSTPQIPGYITLHVRDARPEHYFDKDCIFVTSDAHPSIWSSEWMPCNADSQVEFWMQRGSLRVRRREG
jgi:hypothetical protein